MPLQGVAERGGVSRHFSRYRILHRESGTKNLEVLLKLKFNLSDKSSAGW
jgi:hypothetical protein